MDHATSPLVVDTLLRAETVLHVARPLGLLLLVRALPFVLYATFSKSVPASGKLCSLAGYLTLVGMFLSVYSLSAEVLIGIAVACPYFLGVGVLVSVLRGWVEVGRITRGAIFVLCVLLCMVIPGIVFPRSVANVVLVFGFELTFATYSLCVEPEARPIGLARALHFLLVNPTLVYPLRGTQIGLPALRWSGIVRAIFGVATLVVHHVAALLLPFFGLAYASNVILVHDFSDYVRFVTVVGANVAVWYWGHSGVASLQIGFMRLLGHDIPERYRMPFLARSPQEFWSRWNTYLGAWLYRYVFQPAALRRIRTRVGLPVRSAGAVIAAFSVCGMLHELAIYMETFTMPMGAVLGFFLAGVGLVLWRGAERVAGLRGWRHRRVSSPWVRACMSGASWTLAVNFGLLFAWVFIPAIAHLGLAGTLASLLRV